MNRRRGLRALVTLAVIALGSTAPLAFAHRSHVSLTRVAINARTGVWEIVHAVHYHDALRLLAVRGVSDTVQPSSVEGRARVALEVERSFRWTKADGTRLTPVTVGAELEGDNLLIYQEMPAPAPGTRMAIETSFMQDVFSDQANQVLLEFTTPRHTLTLSSSNRRAEFDGPKAARGGG